MILDILIAVLATIAIIAMYFVAIHAVALVIYWLNNKANKKLDK